MRVPSDFDQRGAHPPHLRTRTRRGLAVLSLGGLSILAVAGFLGMSLATSVGAAPPAGLVRGIYRFDSTDFSAMAGAGFNTSTDGGVNAYMAQQSAAGMSGMVWVPAYDNSTCGQTMSDSEISAAVSANVQAGHSGLVYQIGDEPTTNGCNAAPLYSHFTQLVHGADPLAKSWVADDQFMPGGPPSNNPNTGSIPMAGSVDILAFDVYPCQGSCDFSLIDTAAQRIESEIGNHPWQFIVQDFNCCGWTWPSAADLQAQFDHWKPVFSAAHPPTGYWVFAWDYLGNNLTTQSSFDTLKKINQTYPGVTGGTPSPGFASSSPTGSPSGGGTPPVGGGTSSPTGSPPGDPTPIVTQSTSPDPSPSGSTTPAPVVLNGTVCAVMVNGKLEAGTCTGTFSPGP